MAFLGVHARCKACEKRVFFTDQLTTNDGATFHKACFRCKRCQKPLDINDYASFEGLLYCKPHFEQLSSKAPTTPTTTTTTTTTTDPPTTPTKLPVQKLPELQKTRSKAASFKFMGTQDKCAACTKTVYPLEKVSVEGVSYHKACFKCLQGGCSISPSNYAAMEGRLYCKHHFKQLFKEKGNYSQLLVKLPSAKLPAPQSVNSDIV